VRGIEQNELDSGGACNLSALYVTARDFVSNLVTERLGELKSACPSFRLVLLRIADAFLVCG
jgi:hypothetical protein